MAEETTTVESLTDEKKERVKGLALGNFSGTLKVGDFAAYNYAFSRGDHYIPRQDFDSIAARCGFDTSADKVDVPVYTVEGLVPTHIIDYVDHALKNDSSLWYIEAEKIKPQDWDFFLAESHGLAGGGYQVYRNMEGKLKAFTDYDGTHWAGDSNIQELNGLTYEEACERTEEWNSQRERQPDTHIPGYGLRPIYLEELANMARNAEEYDENGLGLSSAEDRQILDEVLEKVKSNESGEKLKSLR